MVATRRGVRVYSPSKTTSDQASAVQATPSTVRRTRSTAKQVESPTRHGQEEESEGAPPVSPQSQASVKRCTRASRLHSPEQPCTPVGYTHEADVSDLESCCSAVSDIEMPVTRTRGRRRQPGLVSLEEDEVSEVESCSSVVSTSKAGQSTRRSTRKKKTLPESPAGTAAEVESCSSVMSDSQRVTRSQRRSVRTRASAKTRTEDSELSDADSCVSGVSAAEVSVSSTSRALRSRRRPQPIPMYLDEASEGSQSPDPGGRRTRAARGKAAATVVVSEPQSCDSEGFESGPTMTTPRTTRSRVKAKSTAPKATDSESELTDVHSPLGSPCPTRGRGTPCSSRTGSGNSGRAALATRLSAKALSIVLERASSPRAKEGEETGEREPSVTVPVEVNSKVGEVTVLEPAEEKSVLNDSMLESTVIADEDNTLLEEDKTLNLEEEDEEVIEVGPRGSVTMSVDAEMSESTGALPSSSAPQESPDTKETGNWHTEVEAQAVSVGEPAMAATDQQREPSAENEVGDTSEMALMQETAPSSKPLELPSSQSVTVSICEKAAASEVTAEADEKDKAMETSDVDAHTDSHRSQAERLKDKPSDGDAAVETLPGGEEEMEVGSSDRDAQQVVSSAEAPLPPSKLDHVQPESIQVASSREQKVTVEPVSKQQPEESVIVQKKGLISLQESSEDEDDFTDEDEGESSGEEEEEDERMEEETAGPSKTCEAAAASVEGLFMIDTRPGQDANDQYLKEALAEERADAERAEAEQDEQDEDEFIDEEGDDDDEDAQVLFSSRNPQLKELSSRIDPGLRVKELGGLYINFDGSKSKPVSSSLKKLKKQKIHDEVMKKSVIGPDFEKKDAVPPYSETKQALKKKHRAEREKTTGDGWFNMKAPEVTKELSDDLKVLQMRGTLDSKRFYKKNDRDGFPKYFQVGTVVDNPADFYHSRIPKKQRKRTMVEELMADAEFRHNNKKKYQQIMMERAAHGAGRRNKKKNKFHKK